jgi:WD40 repeat protein
LVDDLSYLLHTDAHNGGINDLNFSPKRSDQFASIDENGCTKIWDLSEYKSIFTGVTGKQSSGTSCCIALDDDTIIAGWRDGFIRCFDRSQNILWEVANAHRGAITSIYADANYILSGG